MSTSPQKNLSLYLGAGIVGFVVVLAVVSLLWTPHDPVQAVPADRLQDPSTQYWLGTDRFGRDIASRLMVGAQITLVVGVIAVGISAVVGIPVGIWAAMRGGWTDVFIMRGADLLLAFPALLLAIIAAAVFGPSVVTAMVAIGISGVPGFARVARAGALQVLTQDYISAARISQVPEPVIAWRYLAEYSRAGHCAGVGGFCPGDSCRGRTEFPRPWRQPTESVVGFDAAGGTNPTGYFPAAGTLAGACDRRDCTGL